MNNKDAINFYHDLISGNAGAGVEKHGQDHSRIDADFILQYVRPDTSLLDVASGSGLIVNKLEPHVKHITAVERFEALTRHIKKSPKITVVPEDIFDFETGVTFDAITLFGIISYLNREEAAAIYKKCFQWLKPNGIILIKNQFGVKEDVVVSGYSEDLKRDYYSEYRQLDKETALLKETGFEKIEVTDIYPPEYNRWDNTHFYAIVAQSLKPKA